jgi:SAM-dependent methyltransferase
LSVLDVGAGTGYGLEILAAAGAAPSFGIDPLPLREYISPIPVAACASKSYDVVVACDVIEHVEDDRAFLADLLRVARKFVFLSTPNWNYSRAKNEYHAREYTPWELLDLVAACRATTVWYYTSGYGRPPFEIRGIPAKPTEAPMAAELQAHGHLNLDSAFLENFGVFIYHEGP